MVQMPRIRRLMLFVAAATVACVGQTEAPAESWTDKVEVKVEQVDGEAPALKITLEPKAGWSINTAYPGVKVELGEKTPVDSRTLKKADSRLEDEHPGDKASRIIFETPLSGELSETVEGTYKTVICTKVTCSPPFTGTFSSAAAVAPAPEEAAKKPAADATPAR